MVSIKSTSVCQTYNSTFIFQSYNTPNIFEQFYPHCLCHGAVPCVDASSAAVAKNTGDVVKDCANAKALGLCTNALAAKLCPRTCMVGCAAPIGGSS